MKVLVTGAAGYIAGHCVRELLEHGYEVRGTVRDPSDEAKVGYLRPFGDIELVAADLTDDAGWDEAVAGCEAVLHTASPFFMSDSDEGLVDPAVQGTLRVLGASERGGVKRVVLTSSTAAVSNCEAERYDEENWSDPQSCSAYARSKTLAERAAWSFMDELPDASGMELVVCNPCLVLGPLQSDRRSLSLAVVERVLGRQMPAVPHIGFTVVDVRDVAIGHRLALEHPEAAGQRYILASEPLWMKQVAEILKEEFGAQGFRPPTRHLPYPLLWLASRFDSSLRAILSDVGVRKTLVNAKAKEQLGWQPRPARESVISTGQSLIDRGLVG